MSERNPELPVDGGAVDTTATCSSSTANLNWSWRRRGRRRGHLICAGIDPETSRRSVEMAESFRGVFATAGMHPHTASAMDRAAGNAIEELLANRTRSRWGRRAWTSSACCRRARIRSPTSDRTSRCRARAGCRSSSTSGTRGRRSFECWTRVRAERVVIHCFSGDAQTGARVRRARVLPLVRRQHHLPEERASARGRRSSAARPSARRDRQSLPRAAGDAGRDNAPANVVAVIDELARVRDEPATVVRETTRANAASAFPRLR